MVKLHWIGVAAFLLVFALFSVPSALANEVQITACGTYIQSDTTYLVMNMLVPVQQNADCLVILGDNIVVTTSGAPAQFIMANGPQTSSGIVIEGTNVSVSALIVSGFGTGVRVSSSSDVRLASVISSNNIVGFNFNNMVDSFAQNIIAIGGSTPVAVHGFILTESHNNTFMTAGAFNVTGTYMGIYDSDNNTFIGTSSSYSETGLYLQSSFGNHFEQVYIGDVEEETLELAGGADNSFDGVILDNAGSYGLFMVNAWNNTFSHVNMTDSTGMLLIGTHENTYNDFTIANVSGWALDLSGTTSETFNDLAISDIGSGVGIALEGGVGARFNGCTVNDSGDYGISLDNTEDNIFNNCSLDHTDGLSLIGSSHNAFNDVSVSNSDDLFGFVGVLLLANSIDNNFERISVVNSSLSGLHIQNSHGNKFTDMLVSGTQNNAIMIDGLASGNSFSRLDVQGTPAGYYDIQQSSARDTRFIDSTIGAYLIADSNFSFVKNGTGQVRFFDLVTAQGAEFSDAFQFSSNLFVFEGNESFSNKSAEVTLEGLPTGRINHAITRNGNVCDASICNATSITGATAVFGINQMGNYSISSEEAPAPSTNSGGGGGGGGGGRTTVRPVNNTVTPLSNTNSTPIANNTDESNGVALTGAASSEGIFGKKSLWVIVIVVVALGIASAAVFYVRKMKASGANVAPHMKN